MVYFRGFKEGFHMLYGGEAYEFFPVHFVLAFAQLSFHSKVKGEHDSQGAEQGEKDQNGRKDEAMIFYFFEKHDLFYLL